MGTEALNNSANDKELFVWCNNRIVRIDTKKLVYIAYKDGQIAFVVKDKKEANGIKVTTSSDYWLKDFEDLCSHGFLRAHRHNIINMSYFSSVSNERFIQLKVEAVHKLVASTRSYAYLCRLTKRSKRRNRADDTAASSE